ncbi:MAG: alpha-amylase, partial [Cryomorphaceae bacterium]
MKLHYALILLVFTLAACGESGSKKEAKEEKKEESLYHPDWTKNATIYEVNVRQHTPEGTINALIPDLTRLSEMGVKILWLMPVHP